MAGSTTDMQLALATTEALTTKTNDEAMVELVNKLVHLMEGMLTNTSYVEDRSNRVVQGKKKLERDVAGELARKKQNEFRCQGN